MDIINTVKAHFFQVYVFQHVKHLQENRSLHPASQLIDLDSLISGHNRLFDIGLPVGQIIHGYKSTLFLASSDKFLGNISFIEAFISCIYGFLAALPLSQSFLFCVDQFLQSIQQVRLEEDLTRMRSFTLLTQMWKQDFLRVGPLLDPFFLSLYTICQLFFYGISFCHLHRGLQHFFKAHGSKFCQHDHQTSRCTRGHRSQRAIGRRIFYTLFLEEFWSCPCGGYT